MLLVLGAQSGQCFDFPGMIDGLASRLVVGEQFQYLSLVFRYWGHRPIFISNVSACGDATVNAEEPVNLPE